MTQQDAPGYVPAASPATSCSTCAAFQMRWCTAYDFQADPSWTCESWQRKPAGSASAWPSPLPPSEAYPATTKEFTVTSFMTFKDTKGNWRWVLKSSNAFEDREREVVTTKALENDIARTDKTGEYGPLRWWHVGNPVWKNPLDWRTVVAGKGLDIGDCDFSAMSGPILIESGTFRTPELGAAIAAKAQSFKASLGFSHPIDEPDGDGLFHHINRFERSLTPANKASNMRTGLIVTKELKVDNTKLAAFKEAVGDDIADQVIADAQATTKEARAAGIREKAQEAEIGDLDSIEQQLATMVSQIASFKEKVEAVKKGPPADVTATNVPAAPPVAPNAVVAKKDDAVAADEGDGGDGGETGDEEDVYVGDMTGPEFIAMLHQGLAPLFDPIHKSIDMHGKMSALTDSMKEMKSYLGGMTAKDDQIASLREQMDELTVSFKEAQDQLADLTGGVPKELSRPRGASYKASEGIDNIANPQHNLYQQEPEGMPQNPLAWVDGFVLQQQQAGNSPLQAPVVQNGQVR